MEFKRVGNIKYNILSTDALIPLALLEEGQNLTKDHIIFKDEELIKIFNRKCDHNNGRLCNQAGKIVCPLHGWVFNPETGSYENVQVVKKEEEFVVEGDFIVVKNDKSIAELPSVNENLNIKVELLSHACLLFVTDDFSFATDPWIDGFAFASGWWPSQKPPKNWVEKLNSVDFIYISHNHPDHLNEFTLAKIRKDMQFIVPKFKTDSVSKLLNRFGFKNITSFDLSSYYQYADTPLYLSILKSGDFREDSGFYFTYGNFSCLSTVDSNDLNFSRFPEHVTMFCSSFAGGASGYPICFENIEEEQKKNVINRNRNALRAQVRRWVGLANPDYFLPYAGFFSERAERDSYVKSLNIKNSVQDYVEIFKAREIKVLDLNDSDSFVFYGNELNNSTNLKREFELATMPEDFYSKLFGGINLSDEFIEEFFCNSHFSDNIEVYFQLTNDDFSRNTRNFVVDFSKKNIEVCFDHFDWEKIKINAESDNANRYLMLKIREDSFNWVVKNNMPFEDLSIGFQCRIDRVPDVYNVKFWDHFTNIYIK